MCRLTALTLTAAFGAAFAGAAQAAAPAPPYRLDNAGRCHDSTGNFAMITHCRLVQPKHCRDPKSGRAVSCIIMNSHGKPITDSDGKVIDN